MKELLTQEEIKVLHDVVQTMQKKLYVHRAVVDRAGSKVLAAVLQRMVDDLEFVVDYVEQMHQAVFKIPPTPPINTGDIDESLSDFDNSLGAPVTTAPTNKKDLN